MIHHPILLGAKLVLLVLILVALFILHGILTPEQFRVALWVAPGVFILSVLILWVAALKMLTNPDSKLAQQMILSPTPHADEGKLSAPDPYGQMVGSRGVEPRTPGFSVPCSTN